MNKELQMQNSNTKFKSYVSRSDRNYRNGNKLPHVSLSGTAFKSEANVSFCVATPAYSSDNDGQEFLPNSVSTNELKNTLFVQNEAKEVSSLRLQSSLDVRRKEFTIARKDKANTDIHSELKLMKNELKAVKKKSKKRIISIRQHVHQEQERVLEINELKSEVNMLQLQLTQTQDELKKVSKKLNNTMKQSPEKEHMVVQPNKAANHNYKSKGFKKELARTQEQLKYFKKILRIKISAIKKKIQREQKIKEQLNKAEEEICTLRKQLVQTQNELEGIKRELNDKLHTTQQKTQHEQRIKFNKATEELVQKQLTQTQHELVEGRKHLIDNAIAVQQKLQQEHMIMQGLKAEVNMLRNQLIETQDELREVRKELSCRSNSLQQKTLHEQQLTGGFYILQNQLANTLQELDLARKALNNMGNVCQQKVQQQQIIMIELNKSEKEVKVLRDQLTGTQYELNTVRKGSNDTNSMQQKKKKVIMEELKKAEEEYNILQNQLAKTLQELNETRKNMEKTCQRKAQQQQKTMIELRKAEKEVKVLQVQFAGAENELMIVRKELNDNVNSIQQNVQWEKKVTEVRFSEIRLMLMKKLGCTEQNKMHFEGYMLGKCSQGMMSDIRKLIEDKMQLVDENIKSTVNGSNILKLTENEVHLVISVASFLKSIPFSSSTDFIYSFVAQIDNVISRQHVEGLLKKFPTIFKEELVGVGSSDKNWRYLDLAPIFTI